MMTLISSISGIRGTIGGLPGEGLSPLDIVKFTAAYAHWIKLNNKTTHIQVILGMDARISGEIISRIVSGTLQSMGINVIDIGLSTTPTVEMAVIQTNSTGGIIITASHNPGNWNALKLLNSSGEFLNDKEGKTILDNAKDCRITFSHIDGLGDYTFKKGFLEDHINKICSLPVVDLKSIAKAGLKVVVDAVNSSGGIAVPLLLNKLGVKNIIKLYCEPTGEFPHNPEPLPENLTELSEEVIKSNAHLGIVVDPDVDRLAFVCEDGEMFGEEYTLVAVADYILSKDAGIIVSNLSSTRALQNITEAAGGKYFASAVGEVNVVKKMKETSAVIGGEGNGGVIYPELHYGRDALLGIALFLTHLAQYGKSASMLRSKYPDYFISKNKIELNSDIDVESILNIIADRYKRYLLNRDDGVKIDFGDDWVHLRKSNTEPIIRIYAESNSHAKADNIAEKIIEDIKDSIRNH